MAPLLARTNGQCQHRRISVRYFLTAGTARGKASERAADCVSHGIAAVSTRRFASVSLLPMHRCTMQSPAAVPHTQKRSLSDIYSSSNSATHTQHLTRQAAVAGHFLLPRIDLMFSPSSNSWVVTLVTFQHSFICSKHSYKASSIYEALTALKQLMVQMARLDWRGQLQLTTSSTASLSKQAQN